jgi:hypothetical protein
MGLSDIGYWPMEEKPISHKGRPKLGRVGFFRRIAPEDVEKVYAFIKGGCKAAVPAISSHSVGLGGSSVTLPQEIPANAKETAFNRGNEVMVGILREDLRKKDVLIESLKSRIKELEGL